MRSLKGFVIMAFKTHQKQGSGILGAAWGLLLPQGPYHWSRQTPHKQRRACSSFLSPFSVCTKQAKFRWEAGSSQGRRWAQYERVEKSEMWYEAGRRAAF